MRRIFLLIPVLFLFHPVPPAHAARGATRTAVQSPQLIDSSRRIDINALNMWSTNYGSFAWDLTTGIAGLEYPKGSGKTALFAGGLWLGARVNGEVRTVVAEYSMEYGPGNMVGGTYADPTLPQFRTYKVLPWTGNPADTGHVSRSPGPLEDPLAHHSWSEYMAGAAPYGAPWRIWQLPDPYDATATVPVPGPDVQGHQMLWVVFNDANPANHTNDAGGSPPLGVEVQQTTFGFNQPGTLGNTIFVKYRIINKGLNTLDDMFVSLWTDPDLGGAADDLVGCDSTLGMVYCYNANNADQVYGATPPAVGVLQLEGPKDAVGDTIPVTSAVRYINSADPTTTAETYNYMQGLLADGSQIVDPTTSMVTTFMYPGDPVQGTGWLDSNPSDRRMMLSSGTFSMAPGDVQEVAYAIVIGQGSDRLSSINALKANAGYLKTGVQPPPPPPPLTNCPRPASYWANECASSPGELTAEQLASIASLVGTQSLLFDWPAGSEAASFCGTISPSGPLDARSTAKTEFATTLANWAAGHLGIVPSSGQPIRLLEGMGVSCSGVTATTLGELIQTAGTYPSLVATYWNDNALHRRALTGVNWAGQTFYGGADYGSYFWGGALDPAAHPDSFPSLEIRFSQTNTQMGYRYLRLETADGNSPLNGREYRYGGFHAVPFEVWDTDHDVQLDVAWVERTVADDNGTIQPPASQPATFDSTWAPDASSLGGREYLYLLHTPYSDTPKPQYEIDDAMDNTPMSILYGLWAALRSESDVIDDGDRMTFEPSPYSGIGVDKQLLDLEGQPLGDPAVVAAYTQITDCLRDINTGVTIANPCDQVTAVQISLVSADANSDRVTLEWYTPQASLPVTIERRTERNDWAAVAEAYADGSGMIRYVDTDVSAGAHYDYRLTFVDEGTLTHAGEVSVVIPAAFRLALSGFVPNPAVGAATVEFVLASRAPATLAIFDLQGRRVASREVGHLGPGRATVSLREAHPLRSGVYLITLRQGGASVSRKAVVVN